METVTSKLQITAHKLGETTQAKSLSKRTVGELEAKIAAQMDSITELSEEVNAQVLPNGERGRRRWTVA